MKSEGRLIYNHIFYIHRASELYENEGRLSYNHTFYIFLGIRILWKRRTSQLFFVLFYILLAIEILASQLESYFLQMSGQRNSMRSEGRLIYIFFCYTSSLRNSMKSERRLSYNNILYVLLGMVIL